MKISLSSFSDSNVFINSGIEWNISIPSISTSCLLNTMFFLFGSGLQIEWYVLSHITMGCQLVTFLKYCKSSG